MVDDGVPRVPGAVDEGDGVVAAGREPVGDAVGVVVDTGEPTGVGAGGDVVVDIGEFAGAGAGGEVEVDAGEIDGEGELFEGYGDSGDGAIPFPEGVCAVDGG